MTKGRRSPSYFPVPFSGSRAYGPAWFLFQGLIDKGKHAKSRDVYRGEGTSRAACRRLTRERRRRRTMVRESRRRNRT